MVHIHKASNLSNWLAWLLSLGLPKTTHMLNTQGVTEKFGIFSEIVKRKGDSKFDRTIWGCLLSHI